MASAGCCLCRSHTGHESHDDGCDDDSLLLEAAGLVHRSMLAPIEEKMIEPWSHSSEPLHALHGDAPFILLLLALDDSVLVDHVPVGLPLVHALGPMLSSPDGQEKRLRIVESARRVLACPCNSYWKRISKRPSRNWEWLKRKHRGKKGDVMNRFEAETHKHGVSSFYPSLLQIVFKTEARQQVMAETLADVLVCMRAHLPGFARQWVYGDEERGTDACSSDRFGVWQILQVPVVVQRMCKFYVDWDLMLSQALASNFFQPGSVDDACESNLPADDPCAGGSMPPQVRFLRRVALATPTCIASMLREHGMIPPRAVHVLVKDGTRQKGSDWKISFHFIFQISMSLLQFKAVYELIVSYIRHAQSSPGSEASCARGLSHLLRLGSLRPYQDHAHQQGQGQGQESADHLAMCDALNHAVSLRAQASGEESSDAARLLSSLVGMDLHPRQSAHQGLACLGSIKPGAEKGNRLLGMMRVPHLASSRAEWDGAYASSTHPLRMLADASSVHPAPLCIVLAPVSEWKVPGRAMPPRPSNPPSAPVFPAQGRSDEPLNESVGECMKRVNASEHRSIATHPALHALLSGYQQPAAASSCHLKASAHSSCHLKSSAHSSSSGAQQKRRPGFSRPALRVNTFPSSSSRSESLSSSRCASVVSSPRPDACAAGPEDPPGIFATNGGRGLRELVECMPAWFRARVASLYQGDGDDVALTMRAFRNGNASMPCLQSVCPPLAVARGEAAVEPRKNAFAPHWMIQVNGTEMCMCMLSMMAVPFEVNPIPRPPALHWSLILFFWFVCVCVTHASCVFVCLCRRTGATGATA